MLTINALAAANRVIIPVQAQYLPAKGLEQLLKTVSRVQRQINPKLKIDGILLTMVDGRTNYAREISGLLRDTYGSKIRVFATDIPHSVRAAETSAAGKSIFAHDLKGKVATAYVDGNPLTGTYRRNGEGDYRCTPDAVQAMMRDASAKTQDMTVLEDFDLSALDMDSLRRYRIRMQSHRPGHVWEELDDADFLYKIGAVGRGEGGKIHPTAGGLLMFGYEYEITRYFPAYFLDYQERLEDDTRWTDRIVSSSGDWSGNLYDFYFRVYHRLQQEVRVPFRVENGERVDETPVHTALREALANCLINADYYGTRGVVIVRKKDCITLSNPGSFRIPLEEARSGGLSDPRNTALMKMFNLINVGERAGSGIPSILSVWKKQHWAEPVLTEELSPERITLSLPLQTVAIKSSDKKVAIKNTRAITDHHKAEILQYLTEHVQATCTELAQMLNLSSARVRKILTELQSADLVVSEGANKNRTYRLKA